MRFALNTDCVRSGARLVKVRTVCFIPLLGCGLCGQSVHGCMMLLQWYCMRTFRCQAHNSYSAFICLLMLTYVCIVVSSDNVLLNGHAVCARVCGQQRQMRDVFRPVGTRAQASPTRTPAEATATASGLDLVFSVAVRHTAILASVSCVYCVVV